MRLLVILLLLISFSAYGYELTTAEKLSDLNQIVSMMKSGYGPLNYKSRVKGINIDEVYSRYVDEVKETTSNGDFYYTLVRFVAEFEDSHFAAGVPTNHKALTGFFTELIEGKVLIQQINRDILPVSDFPFQKGDEIISIDGVNTQTVLAKLKKQVSAGFSGTRDRIAAWYISYRNGVRVPVPTNKDITFSIKNNSGVIKDITVDWVLKGTPLDEYSGFTPRTLIDVPFHNRNFYKISIKDEMENHLGPNLELTYMCSGGTRIEIPAGATVIMEKPFVAYYHSTPKGNIGYLRIPHYSPKNSETGKAEVELRYYQYQYAVKILEENTVGLIIDQDHNCGGSVAYLHQIASLFVKTPFTPVLFELLASKAEYLDFFKWMAGADAHTIDYVSAKEVVDVIYKSWMNGDFLTPKISFYGEKIIKNSGIIRYTSPIVMLIDEMSGSGGDAFPALLKGLGRVKLLGTRTMGAGGHVISMPPLNYSGMNVSMTRSLFYRPDGVAVENNGAVPDVPYTITKYDMLNEYKDYQKFYIRTLLDML